MQHIKVSAILPNYNSSDCLPTALLSLLNQKETFDEIIVVDDGSTDKSIEIVSSFMQTYKNIHLIRHEKNLGVNAALNTGLNHAKGDYILLAAADDTYYPDSLLLAKEIMRQFPSIGIICGDAIVHRFDLKQAFYRMLPFPANCYISPEEFKTLSRKTYVGFNSGGGMFINALAIRQAGLLKIKTYWHGDWLLYFVVAFRKGLYYINSTFIDIHMRKKSYSEGKNNKKMQDRIMLDTVKILSEDYSDVWIDFKKAALLPHYTASYILLFFFDSKARQFLTFKLIWKCLINNVISVKIGRLFPYKFILAMRKILKA